LARQIEKIKQPDGRVDPAALLAIVERTYHEFDRERRLNDRAAKLMEEELKAVNDFAQRCSEKKLIEALEAAPCAVALLDADWRVQNANSAMCDMLGQYGFERRMALVGTPFYELVSRAAPQVDPGELALLSKGGSIECSIADSWYLGSAHHLSDGSVTVAFSNITALKEREAAIALARDAAEYGNRVKSEFMATMSHELRTPLNAILGFSEVIRDNRLGKSEEPPAHCREYAGLIHSSGQHLLELISDILDLSKIEAGSFEIHPEIIDMSKVVEMSLALVRPQAERGQVRLLPFIPPENREIEADVRSIKQTIVNLLSNAVKFTPPGGEVEISMQTNAGGVNIKVRDTGIGIAPKHLERIFDPFYQIDPHLARGHEGTGLGLAITKKLIECHGGTISVLSEMGRGTCVIVFLPKRLCAQPAPPRSQSAA